MSPGARLGAFAAGLAALAVLAFGVGRLVDVSAPGDEAGAEAMAAHADGREPASHAAGATAHPKDAGDSKAAHGEGAAHGESAGHGAGGHPVRGLGVAENGLRLSVLDPEWRQGTAELLRFQILGADGAPLTAFDTTHTKRMHVIVVRRDLTGFKHLHPEMAADGTWTVPLRLADAGTYRVFADFAVGGEATTLADDLRVDGDADLRGLPAPATEALSAPGGYSVALRSGGAHESAHAGEETSLRFEVSRAGRPATLQPYLGAGGHLVALREGDLAFLHVHPTGDAGKDGSIDFEATFPTAGNYRLFLQFEVGGVLQTVAFTAEVH